MDASQQKEEEPEHQVTSFSDFVKLSKSPDPKTTIFDPPSYEEAVATMPFQTGKQFSKATQRRIPEQQTQSLDSISRQPQQRPVDDDDSEEIVSRPPLLQTENGQLPAVRSKTELQNAKSDIEREQRRQKQQSDARPLPSQTDLFLGAVALGLGIFITYKVVRVVGNWMKTASIQPTASDISEATVERVVDAFSEK